MQQLLVPLDDMQMEIDILKENFKIERRQCFEREIFVTFAAKTD